MILYTPPEIELFERGFSPSSAHDEQGLYFSYEIGYSDGSLLVLQFSIDFGICVVISNSNRIVAEVAISEPITLHFQQWDGEQTIRVYSNSTDLRIHYNPNPAIHFCQQNRPN